MGKIMTKRSKYLILLVFLLNLLTLQLLIQPVSAASTYRLNWSYLTGDGIYSVAISADGQYVVTGSYDHKIYLFQKSSNTTLWTYSTGSDVESVAISADGQYIVAGTDGYYIYFFQRTSNTTLWSYSIAGTGSVVAISSNGQYVAAGSLNNIVYFFSRSSGGSGIPFVNPILILIPLIAILVLSYRIRRQKLNFEYL
jgi:WD40 repeat protein